jgi:geranylgeranyl diphosphate synthase, type II
MISQKHIFEDYLHSQMNAILASYPQAQLAESVRYSLFQNSKRFRPVLALLTAEMMEVALDRVLPWASALEMVHTYSLVHDDLPCMDDDEMRRGEPTNHRVYGESTALLAGDTLLTEAFRFLAKEYKEIPALGLELIFLLGSASGGTGMISGQVMDLKVAAGEAIQYDKLTHLHRLKTGQLIHVAVMGVAVLARASTLQKEQLSKFAENLGLAFQLADDLHDYLPDAPERNGYPALIGVKGTEDELRNASEAAVESLRSFGAKAQPLIDMVRFNQKRTT